MKTMPARTSFLPHAEKIGKLPTARARKQKLAHRDKREKIAKKT
jgi:hypothetical protein